MSTFNERFAEISQRYSDRIAFRLTTSEGYRDYTYKEAYDKSREVARSLLAKGLPRGARIAVLSENRPEWVIAYLGIYLAGGIVVPLDAQISPPEWRRLLDDSESLTIFVSGGLFSKLREALPDLQPPREIVCFDTLIQGQDSCIGFDSFLQRSHSVNPPSALPECQSSDAVAIIYTSGTTGTPKGVMLTHGNIMAELQAVLSSVHADETDSLLCLLPLQHVLASVINVLVPLYLGAQVVFADTLKRSEILAALEQAGITILVTVPQFFYLFHDRIMDELNRKSVLTRLVFPIMRHFNRICIAGFGANLGKVFFGKVHRSFGSKLRLFVCGGSSFDAKVAADFRDMGFAIIQGYGLTETTGACSVTRVENNVIGSTGPALPGVEISISSPDEKGVGEILIRGPIVMKGYYNNPEATAEAFENGWFRSGDLGRLDDKGNLYITGRKKEIIVLPSGKNIYPDELEAHFLQCPYIEDIAVISIKDSSGREAREHLHAVVVPNFEYMKAKKIANIREILRDEIGRMSSKLPQYKRLMSYQIQADPLPYTTTQKIRRFELKRLVESGEQRNAEMAPVKFTPADRALMESAVGQEVLGCLKESCHRDGVGLDMNLELDLGFDSMERVELLASLEQVLGFRFPEDFASDIFTVRDLISRILLLSTSAATTGSTLPSNWCTILSGGSPSLGSDGRAYFSGAAAAAIRYVCARLIYYLVFRPFLRLRAWGVKNFPKEGPFLICPNHLSYIDAFVLISILPFPIHKRMFFVGYSEYFTKRCTRPLARLANIVPVDPDAHLLRAMRISAAALRQDRILCIFPEGGRSFDGNLQEFKKGAAILSREIDIPMIPVGIRGTYEVWPRNSMRIRPGKVEIRIGTPLRPGADSTPDPYQADIDRLRAEVAKLLNGSAIND
jgi:long-chain acyl-CoA synthetase